MFTINKCLDQYRIIAFVSLIGNQVRDPKGTCPKMYFRYHRYEIKQTHMHRASLFS